MKVCKKCGLPKPLNNFYKSKSNADGREGSCKVCRNIQVNTRLKDILVRELSTLIQIMEGKKA